MSALDTQVGGNHYKGTQPVEFIHKNGLGYIVGCCIKYLCRYKLKGTPIQDLRKVRHYIDILIEMELAEVPGDNEVIEPVSIDEATANFKRMREAMLKREVS
jgi:hypothetical protein